MSDTLGNNKSNIQVIQVVQLVKITNQDRHNIIKNYSQTLQNKDIYIKKILSFYFKRYY